MNEAQQTTENKKPIYKKWWFWVGGVIILFILIGALGGDDTTETTQQTEEVTETTSTPTPSPTDDTQSAQEAEVIDFSVLREWNPDNDSQALGLEILVSESDATEENIVNLIRSLSTETQKSVIKVYQDRQAWEEEQSGEYTSAYDRGYLAFYVKNLTDSGAYRGRNEIRWFQEVGQLEHLMGTTIELD